MATNIHALTAGSLTTSTSTVAPTAATSTTTAATNTTTSPSYSVIFQVALENFTKLTDEISEGKTIKQVQEKLESIFTFTQLRKTLIENLRSIQQNEPILKIFKDVYGNSIDCFEALETEDFHIFKLCGHLDDIGKQFESQAASHATAVQEAYNAFYPLLSSINIKVAKSASTSPPTVSDDDCVFRSPPASARSNDTGVELSLAPLAAFCETMQSFRLSATESASS